MYLRGMAAAAALAMLAGTAVADPLAGSEWASERFGSVVVPTAVEHFMRFESGGRVSGHGGCNRFSGTYAVEGEALSIGPLAATRMACAPPRMEIEAAFFAVLGQTAAFRRDRHVLTLVDAAGQDLATFEQRDRD